jgi:hypothetical protein
MPNTIKTNATKPTLDRLIEPKSSQPLEFMPQSLLAAQLALPISALFLRTLQVRQASTFAFENPSFLRYPIFPEAQPGNTTISWTITCFNNTPKNGKLPGVTVTLRTTFEGFSVTIIPFYFF